MVKRVKVVVVVDTDNADTIVVACCNAPSIEETPIDTANLLFVSLFICFFILRLRGKRVETGEYGQDQYSRSGVILFIQLLY